ncbi:hypothetical protein ACFXPT_33210 [Streptomyces goshikiensis]|uniref:hypothetical protein n=1 Tax=Streptomyces goshikiensis TaxID=1942 RepID=UPI0036B72172
MERLGLRFSSAWKSTIAGVRHKHLDLVLLDLHIKGRLMTSYCAKTILEPDSLSWAIFELGGRSNQKPVQIRIAAEYCDTLTLVGDMTYDGEGPIGFKATMTGRNTYEVENQWGGDDAPWHPGGTWVIGALEYRRVKGMHVTSDDSGRTLSGTITYEGQDPLTFQATATEAVT